MTATLHIEKRELRGKQLGKLRKEGKLPGVIYGPKHEAMAITLDKIAFEKVFRGAGESSIITLEGVGESAEVLVHEVAFDAERGGLTHVDFYAIEKGKEITVHVAIEFVGEAPAVKLGGSLTKVLHEIEVTCKPAALPQHFTVDVSSLDDFEKQIHVKDLIVPAGVKIENDADEVIALVQEVKEEAETEVTAIDMDAIETEEKGKKVEEPAA